MDNGVWFIEYCALAVMFLADQIRYSRKSSSNHSYHIILNSNNWFQEGFFKFLLSW